MTCHYQITFFPPHFEAGFGLPPVWYPMSNGVVLNVGYAPSQNHANFLRDHKIMAEK